jgi:CRISPR-associated protein Cas2
MRPLSTAPRQTSDILDACFSTCWSHATDPGALIDLLSAAPGYAFAPGATYDIGDPKRWRHVFRVMEGFREWLQLSVFQCRLSAQRHAELIALLDGIIHHDHDHVMLVELGCAERVMPRVVSLGKTYSPVQRVPLVV